MLTIRPKYLKSDVVLAKTWFGRAGTCPLTIRLASHGHYQNNMKPLMKRCSCSTVSAGTTFAFPCPTSSEITSTREESPSETSKAFPRRAVGGESQYI